jgi:DNA (cytosine-5)-methyltransferase 1
LNNNNKGLNFQKIFETAISQYRNTKKVTVKDAIWDLPRIKSGKGNNYFWKKKYEKSGSVYSGQLACLPMGGILNHFARNHMEEDLERYRYFAEYARKNCKNATLYDLTRDSKDLLPKHRSAANLIDEKGKKNRNAKYVDRFKVQLKNEPATTITAHIAKDGHAFIHPLPGQNRSLTVREAARLQSFPDDYAFCGPRTEQFKQVGNAVPVLLAKIIATGIKQVLESCNGR